MQNVSAEECQDSTVYKHNYRVRVSHTLLGKAAVDQVVSAGSRAHAALIVGTGLIAELLLRINDPDEMSTAMHNICDHMTVDVELTV